MHTPVSSNLSGEPLLEQVVQDYTPNVVLDYSSARDVMYGTIYKVNDSVHCVYTGHSLYLPNNVDPSTYLYMNSSSDGITAEHTYPRSMGASEALGNGYSDMHHIFPARSGVNNARSNLPFGEIVDEQAQAWYFLNQTQSNTPSEKIDLFSERSTTLFEPREDHKGNVARAIFYFFTIYHDAAILSDSTFFETQRATLCNWHELDPVDELEWQRTHQIALYQSNKPNPFVLDCTLAQRSYCPDNTYTCAEIPEEVTTVNPTKQSNIKLFPNPVVNTLHVKSKGPSYIEGYNLLGETIINQQFYDQLELDFSSFATGMYTLVVNGEVHKIVK